MNDLLLDNAVDSFTEEAQPETTMFDWECISREYSMERCEGVFGSWTISPDPNGSKFVTRGSYQLATPTGEDPYEFRKSILGDAKLDFDNADHRRLFAMVSPQTEVVHCATIPLMKLFIAAVHGADPAQPWKEIVEAAGFKPLKWDADSYQIKANKGTMAIRETKEGNVHVTYEQRGRHQWWNLLTTRDAYFPHEKAEMLAIAAKFAVEHILPWVNETEFHKPQPRVRKDQKIGNLMDMMEEVDKVLEGRGHGDQRDFFKSSGFDPKKSAVKHGMNPDHFDVVYRTAQNAMAAEDKAIMDKVRDEREQYKKDHRYCDYWSFMLDQLPDLENDINMKINFKSIMDAATEDWQKEIGQVYLDLFGAKEQVVRVSW